MHICGSRVRNACIIVFDFLLLAAFPCHSIDSPVFWGALGGLMAVCGCTVVILEILRFMVPDFTDQWWDPLPRGDKNSHKPRG